MKKIISFSLYGDAPRYHVGALQNAELAQKEWGDWICRFYVSNTGGGYLKGRINARLAQFPNVELVHKHWDRRGSKPMFWRFYAASDPDASHVIFRDCDSRISRMEKDAVDLWIQSGADFHFITGHPNHLDVKIMGGLWGIKGGVINDMESLVEEWGEFGYPRGVDQAFLARIVSPIADKTSKLHSHLDNNPYGDGVDFAGQPFDEHNKKLC